MIVLDTNVISELWKIEPNPNVLTWIDAQAVETLYLTAITVAELRYGLATMPAGKRRTVYQDRLEEEVLPAFTARILPFDLDASRIFAEGMARARADGKAIGKEDGYIAAIAKARGFAVATRDVAPFRAFLLSVLNPWEATP
ncbi:type II toxin-antitoxin system VapC family toxin [Candidatus Igneacidithiobacillus taiwanensis]|uniref:type II toxin-antitoxin system VapC family toxin n=1 Tax=Candidatus Igneacidithiobacillus taiwanensis TaxID=1945924 RepID=UPI00289BCCBC|nr:type II toxin-antitoxin system VapC family toxin [Candidatus Igneacidithiobacillus taiwanensis]MCE5361239.1 type II toxin-antitoxin system VapC family toxin [Acidithiobacillus sp.]